MGNDDRNMVNKDKTKFHSIIEIFRTAIFDTIPDSLIVLTPDLTILTANDAFYESFRVKTSDVLDRKIFDIGNRQWDIPELRILLEKILPEKSIIDSFEVTHGFPEIGERTFLINAREIKSNDFLPMDLILITLIDITDRKKWTDSILELNEQLKIANTNLERYGDSLAHDLRAPLRAILGFSKIVMEELGTESAIDIREYLQRILHNAENMDQMILGLSQIAGIARASINRHHVSLSDIANKVAIELRLENPDRAAEIYIQQNMFESVEPSMMLVALNNLLKNSWKFTRSREFTKINFGSKDHYKKKVYFINDNGVGFNMNNAGRLFGMFQRLHSTAKFEGTGTGLAIVRTIIEKHNGEVWAESEEGKGTTIYFTIGH